MEATITQRRDNPLLGRTEVFFTIVHEKSGTPSRSEIRKALAGVVGTQGGLVVLAWARSEFGRNATRGYAKVYKEKERALEVETLPVLIRNGLREAAKKAEAPAGAGPPAPPPPKKEAAKPEMPKKEPSAPKSEPPKKEVAKPETPKKAEAPAKAEKKEAPPAKKEAAPKEKKPAGKKEAK